MTTAALELNDASLAIALAGEVQLTGPGYVALVAGALRFGDEARAAMRLDPRNSHRRYWAEMSETPLARPLAACRSTADLVHEHLASLRARCAQADAVAFAMMPGWSANQLGLLLGIAADAGIPVRGMVDLAVAESRRPYPGRELWTLDPTLAGMCITRIGQDGGAATLGERVFVDRCGMDALERGCAEFLARRFVECSRLDPLHDSRSEQQLFDRMTSWLDAARRHQKVEMALEHAGNHFNAWFEPAALHEHVARLCEPVSQRLRALLPAHAHSLLQVHARLADIPGVIESLMRLPGCTVVVLEPGAGARGALRLRADADVAAGLRLATTLPFDQAPDADTPSVAAVGGAPTHVVFRGRAWRLAAGPVQVGTGISDLDYGVRLDGSAAISRRHCSIEVQDGRVVVYDQSRYGTLLNGHRISGVAVLQAGDVLSIGSPPQQLTLVAEADRG